MQFVIDFRKQREENQTVSFLCFLYGTTKAGSADYTETNFRARNRKGIDKYPHGVYDNLERGMGYAGRESRRGMPEDERTAGNGI